MAGFECSGNSRAAAGALPATARWTGVPLRTVLDQAGVKRDAREFVFFGADKGQEEVEFRTQKFNVEQQFGRSLHARTGALAASRSSRGRSTASRSRVTRARRCGCIVPGWYGVANVKWLSNIHVQEEPYLGKFQARWYRTLRGREHRRRDEVEGDRRHADAA